MWPDPDDYVGAVLDPRSAFTDPILRSAHFPLTPGRNRPMLAVGRSAVVFRADTVNGARALRLFTTEQSSRDAYGYVDAWVAKRGLGTYVARSRWVDDAILVGGALWPLVDMEWVDGAVLDTYVSALLYDRDVNGLNTLAEAWLEMVHTLQGRGFAHGDLQHGNVLVNPDGAIRLVDLDEAWTPDTHHDPPPALAAHPNYQLPGARWGRWMDTFPGLTVYVGLRALAAEPGLWTDDDTTDRVVLDATDIAAPGDTSTWELLDQITDATFRRHRDILRECCAGSRDAWVPLRDLLDPPSVSGATPLPRGAERWWDLQDRPEDRAQKPVRPTAWRPTPWRPTPTGPTPTRPGPARPTPAAPTPVGSDGPTAWLPRSDVRRPTNRSRSPQPHPTASARRTVKGRPGPSKRTTAWIGSGGGVAAALVITLIAHASFLLAAGVGVVVALIVALGYLAVGG